MLLDFRTENSKLKLQLFRIPALRHRPYHGFEASKFMLRATREQHRAKDSIGIALWKARKRGRGRAALPEPPEASGKGWRPF